MGKPLDGSGALRYALGTARSARANLPGPWPRQNSHSN